MYAWNQIDQFKWRVAVHLQFLYMKFTILQIICERFSIEVTNKFVGVQKVIRCTETIQFVRIKIFQLVYRSDGMFAICNQFIYGQLHKNFSAL